MERAFGALRFYSYSSLSAEGAFYASLGRSPRNEVKQGGKGL
jgi:hypothetical protein